MPKPRATLQRVLSSARFLLNVAGGGAAVATILGFAGSRWWVFELLEHLSPPSSLCVVLGRVVGRIARRAWSFVWCFPLVLNLALIVPLFFTSAQGSHLEQANRAPNSTFRLLYANLDHDNKDTSRAVQYIESQDVNLVLLQEVTSRWLTKLKSDLSRYRVVTSFPRENSTGMAMLVPITPSKSVEIVATQLLELPLTSGQPFLEPPTRWRDTEVVILSLSIIRPQNRDTSAFQDVEFNAAADWSLRQQKKDGREVVIIGDFNSTPWSGRFRKFLHDKIGRASCRERV